MRNKLFEWMLVLLGLVLLNPFVLRAENAGNESEPSTIEQQLKANAPQSAEDLLLAIRDFLANPNIDGVAFAEKLTGLSKSSWGPASSIQTGFAQDSDIRLVGHYLGAQFKKTLTVPYEINRITIEENTHVLPRFDLDFFRPIKSAYDLPDYILELTPTLTRKILGPPDKVNVTSPGFDFSRGEYILYYTYVRGQYEWRVSFTAKGDMEKHLTVERAQHNMEQSVAEISRRKVFENHKDFLAGNMRLSRKK